MGSGRSSGGREGWGVAGAVEGERDGKWQEQGRDRGMGSGRSRGGIEPWGVAGAGEG